MLDQWREQMMVNLYKNIEDHRVANMLRAHTLALEQPQLSV